MIDKCSEYIKELKLTNNPRLWLEVAIIDLANLTENTTLAELQNRLARLEGGEAPVRISAVKPIVKPVAKEEIKTPVRDTSAKKPEETHIETTKAPQQEFSPMPKSKPVEGADVLALWGQLLDNIQSAPTRALLKQWAKPVQISPDETVLTMKNEIFLNQVQSGAKKQSIIQAIDSLFGQSNSNVVIRLPQAGDDAVRQPTVAPPKKEEPKPIEIEPQEVEEVIQELEKEEAKPEKKTAATFHSDNVNMVMDLFDGKVID